MRGFAGLVGFIALTLFLQTGCVGGFKDMRIGKTFVITSPDKVVLLKERSLESETFHLDKPDVFTVEDLTSPKEYTFGDKAVMFSGEGKDLVSSKGRDSSKTATLADVNIAGLYKVRFDSGVEAYINSRYIYPYSSSSEYILSEGEVEERGMTTRQYLEWFKERSEENRKLTEMLPKVEKDALDKFERERREKIFSLPWNKEKKQFILDRKLRVGMTKEEVSLSLNTLTDFPRKNVGEKGTSEGVEEEWIMAGGKTYRFRNNVLAEWEMKEVSCEDVLKRKHSFPGYKALYIGMTPAEVEEVARCVPWKNDRRDYRKLEHGIVVDRFVPEAGGDREWKRIRCMKYEIGVRCTYIEDILIVYIDGTAGTINFRSKEYFPTTELGHRLFSRWLSHAYMLLEERYGEASEVIVPRKHIYSMDMKEGTIAIWDGMNNRIWLGVHPYGNMFMAEIIFMNKAAAKKIDEVLK